MQAYLQQVLACVQEVLRFQAPGVYPFDYVGTQNNLGCVYLEMREQGNSDGLLRALTCFL
ncbi:MAG TPA: hypothetical protein VFN35_07455 [Ktedonobacteraceae bacterium]|nr:hypothetical protein [Ktedonobacteraceae bacterium]